MTDSHRLDGALAAHAWTPAAMLERLGDDEELARQLVDLFVDDCPRMMADVRESVRAGSADLVRRAAHAFKGSVGNFTDGAPMTTAYQLETLGRDGVLDGAPALLARLEREVEEFLEALHRYHRRTP